MRELEATTFTQSPEGAKQFLRRELSEILFDATMARRFPSDRGSNLILYNGEIFSSSRGSPFVDSKRKVLEYVVHG
jgi:hypothetical protein